MQDTQCVACHKGLSLEDIERGGFQHIGGRLYCAECVAKMRRVGPALCPQCQSLDTPLYNGKTFACRKCGAEVSRTGQPAASPKEAPAPQAEPKAARQPKPGKKCPYCAGHLPPEALKCRYCGSSLTREAREAETFSRQNSQLRFWVGCLLSASVFLVLFLLYLLATRGSQAGAPQAVPPDSATMAKADANAALVKELSDELRAVRGQLAALEAEQKRLAAKPPAPSPLPTTLTMPKALADAMLPPPPRREERPAAKAVPVKEKETPAAKEPPAKAPAVAAKEATPPAKGASPIPPPSAKEVQTSPPPPPTPAAKGTTPPETPAVAKVEPPKAKPEERTAAQLAAAAYPVFATELDKLKAGKRFGDAVSLCRQFIAAHLNTPEAGKAQAAQQALREEFDRVRDDHARRFREALAKGDRDGARRIAAELGLYDAPEVREDRDHMLAELKAAEQKPTLDVAKYLTQWEIAPNVARLLQELKTEKDWTTRSRAAKELGRIGHRSAIKGLLDALKDQEWYVKASAIGALADIGDPIALPQLGPLAKASFPVIYDPAARACRTLAAAPRDKFADAWKLVDPKAAAQEIAEALKAGDKEESPVTSRYQIALVETLALLGAKESAPAIRPLFDKAKDPAVRKAAAEAIQALTGEKLMPDLAPPPKAAPAPEPPKKAEPPAKAPEPPAKS